MSREAMKRALGKIKSARDCHPNAVDALLFEAEEILEEALAEQPAQQEPVTVPVGYWHKGSGAFFKGAYLTPAQEQMRESGVIKPLYTSPPAQRTWVGLTIDEVESGAGLEKAQSTAALDLSTSFWAGARWAEAKLKERNQ